MINNTLKLVVILLSIVFISSCAGRGFIYSYEFNSYPDKESALKAQLLDYNNLLSQVQPFEKSLVDKKLIISIPTRDQIDSDYVLRSSQPGQNQRGDLDYVVQLDCQSFQYTYSLIKKKNIYKTVELVAGSYSSIIQPSSTVDTFCAYSSGTGRAVWYMLNIKNGKQVFSYDYTSTTLARQESFLNAVKAFALQ